MPSGGGSPTQITRTGATGPAYESADEEFVMFQRDDALFRVRIDGGPEQRLVPAGVGSVMGFAVSNAGVYWLGKDSKTVRFLELATGRTRVVATLDKDKEAGELAVSADGRYLLWVQFDKLFVDLMLVENFR